MHDTQVIAKKRSPDDMSGLEPAIFLAKGVHSCLQ